MINLGAFQENDADHSTEVGWVCLPDILFLQKCIDWSFSSPTKGNKQ